MTYLPCHLTALLLWVVSTSLPAMDVAEALPLTDQIVMVHLTDGHAVHHQLGQKRTEGEAIVGTPLDTTAAMVAAAWTVACPGDLAFAAGVHPTLVGRKSKGTDFAWMVQGWDQAANRAINHDPDHASDHWLYLQLPRALTPGKTYAITAPSVPGIGRLTLAYDPRTSRSEAVHVNLIGYVPDMPAKYAYVYHWMGDRGSLDLATTPARQFHLINQQTGAVVFSGALVFRAPADQAETMQLGDTPHGNYLCAAVWECDFSAFTTPGTFVVAVDGVGCSYPFPIAADVYREAFRTTARGLYQNRSGIALVKPYTEFERPAPHHPTLTPGFAGKLVYTTSRCQDWKNQDADPADRPAIEAGIKGPLAVWGWYQDAGDWDSYPSHLNVATCLLFAYETRPGNFSDQELNIPESGNAMPDILDEAAWLPRFCFRLRHELLKKGWGTGGIGLRVCGDHFGGDQRADQTTKASYTDTDRQWIVSGEDPWSTFRYAGVAAHLAWCQRLAKVADPAGVDWLAEATESYAWAIAHASAKDNTDPELGQFRCYAAAGLFRLTGKALYAAQIAADTATYKVGDELWWNQPAGPWVACLGGGPAALPADLAQRLRAVVLSSCELVALTNSGKRALRWGGHWSMPMLIGQQTTPWIMEGMIGWALTKRDDPAKAAAFRAAVATTCDYFLGTNALNQVWVTGLGVRHVNHVFHLDAWYNGKATPHPGVVPYGPWRKVKDLGQGPWDLDWPNQTVYPGIDQWPGNERWFDNRNCPLSAEFTIHQTTCFAAATYGWMCTERK